MEEMAFGLGSVEWVYFLHVETAEACQFELRHEGEKLKGQYRIYSSSSNIFSSSYAT